MPHPRAGALCEDASVIGAPFMLMELVDGFTPGFDLPEPFASDHRACATTSRWRTSTACAELSEVDWQARGLDGLGKPDGLPRAPGVRAGSPSSTATARATLPELDFVCRWLERNRPAMSPAGDHPRRLQPVQRHGRAGAAGPAGRDRRLGHRHDRRSAARHRPPAGALDRAAARSRSCSCQAGGIEGYPTRAEMAERYAERTGRDLSALRVLRGARAVQARRDPRGHVRRQSVRPAVRRWRQLDGAVLVPQLMKGAAAVRPRSAAMTSNASAWRGVHRRQRRAAAGFTRGTPCPRRIVFRNSPRAAGGGTGSSPTPSTESQNWAHVGNASWNAPSTGSRSGQRIFFEPSGGLVMSHSYQNSGVRRWKYQRPSRRS